MNSKTKILITGSIARDTIMGFPGLFSTVLKKNNLDHLNVSFGVDTLVEHLGGTGLNIAYNTRLLTDAPIYMFGGVGRDHEDIIEFLKQKNINTEGIVVDKELYTATGKVVTDKDQNQIWSFYPGAIIRGKEIDLTPHAKDSILVLSANEEGAFLETQRQAIELGVPYLYDPGMALSWIKDIDLTEGIKHAKWLIGNESEIPQIEERTKGISKNMIERGGALITTFGKDGVEYKDTKNTYRVPVYEIEAKDPTGAGDSWRGGFLAGLLKGKSIEESLALGNAIASFAVASSGTVNHNPTKREVKERARSIVECAK